ncbi:hypothetical protein U1Q18_047758 [Sarracenia purpurea var. burkii]
MAIKRKLRVQFGAAGARLRMCESSIEEKQGYEVLKVVGSQKCCHYHSLVFSRGSPVRGAKYNGIQVAFRCRLRGFLFRLLDTSYATSPSVTRPDGWIIQRGDDYNGRSSGV